MSAEPQLPIDTGRVVTLDLETVPLEQHVGMMLPEPDETPQAFEDRMGKLALSPRTGRVVVACAKSRELPPVDMVAHLESDEAELLAWAWHVIRRADVVVTFNGLPFDLPFLVVRSALLKVPPSRAVQPLLVRYRTRPHFDVRAWLTNWAYGDQARGTKAEWAAAFSYPVQTGTGADVGRWYHEKRFDLIVQHCKADVDETFGMYQRLLPYFV